MLNINNAHLWLQQYGKEVLWLKLEDADRIYISVDNGSIWTASGAPIPAELKTDALNIWTVWKARTEQGVTV